MHTIQSEDPVCDAPTCLSRTPPAMCNHQHLTNPLTGLYLPRTVSSTLLLAERCTQTAPKCCAQALNITAAVNTQCISHKERTFKTMAPCQKVVNVFLKSSTPWCALQGTQMIWLHV